MAKLLITLDGAQVGEIEIAKERITIGRRADNDIQLDHIAVSGQHAVVGTILNDSFLEDLGSTNGTLVNGSAVRKHFLRNGDLIEIGRHRLRFIGDQVAPREAADFEKTMVLNRPISGVRPSAPAGVHSTTLADRPGPGGLPASAPSVAPAVTRPVAPQPAALYPGPSVPIAQPVMAAAVPRPGAAADETSGALAALLESQQALQSHFPDKAPIVLPTAGGWPQPAVSLQPVTSLQPAPTLHPAPSTPSSAATAPLVAPARQTLSAPDHAPVPPAPVPPAPLSASPALQPGMATASDAGTARLMVLNGPAAGRVLEISKPLTTIGRPGVQVAVISRRGDGYHLAQVEGATPLLLRGQPLPAHAVALAAHDLLEIAGIKLEFFFEH